MSYVFFKVKGFQVLSVLSSHHKRTGVNSSGPTNVISAAGAWRIRAGVLETRIDFNELSFKKRNSGALELIFQCYTEAQSRLMVEGKVYNIVDCIIKWPTRLVYEAVHPQRKYKMTYGFAHQPNSCTIDHSIDYLSRLY